MAAVPPPTRAVIPVAALDELLAALRSDGYRVVGPTIRQGAIVHDDIASAADLPVGWTEHQDGGTYRLVRRDDGAVFGFATGPHSWKQFLHPPRVLEWRARRDGGGFTVDVPVEDPPPLAFFGARSCDLRAIAVQDRVLAGGDYPDAGYAGRRAGALVVAVNCGTPGGTCFCVSMGTGPRASAGFDLSLTELLDADRHEFLVEVGTERGADLLERLVSRPAEPGDLVAAERVVADAAGAMGRSMPDAGEVPVLLHRNLEHARWDDVAERCLSCGNCTMVCPTCFCTSPEDVTDLTGDTSERWRRWESCFTLDFSYVHGGSVRPDTRSQYRQWMTHKLSTWWDQFGESGCVGCGRCITWCPVGIDLTEEVAAIRADPPDGRAG
ncbi:MAG TPA: 4Fe-4S dicluster domain-containing protein [Acidimicrobiales bacterium]